MRNILLVLGMLLIFSSVFAVVVWAIYDIYQYSKFVAIALSAICAGLLLVICSTCPKGGE